MPQIDNEKRKAYNKAYYEANKEARKQKYKCEHGKEKSYCIQCGGSQICIHNRQKKQCIQCGGSQICIHNRQKKQCKECDGGSFCNHGRQKSRCKECGGGGICEHDIARTRCKECRGGGICMHNCERARCKECNGCDICVHSKIKQYCKECNPLNCIVQLQRSNIRRVMQQTDIKKTKPSIEYLGCSAEYFRDYILSKMTEGMTFDNIHYDHIKPVSAFNLEDEEDLLNCCHYTNFQPLLATDNLIKSSKWGDEDELFWKANICGKEYLPLYIPA